MSEDREWEAVVDDAVSVMDKAERTIDNLHKRNTALTCLLEEVREAIDRFVDVVDGPDGQPRANWAMSLTNEIDELIGK
jgi:hypothetical protein